jgi:hypothetical protein
MNKIMIDGKEAVFDESYSVPLSEEELKSVGGGALEAGRSLSRLGCTDCSFASWWGLKSREQNYIINFHYSQTGHYHYQTESKYFDSDPNETPAG